MRIHGLKTRAKILIGICSPLALLLALGGVSIYSINSIVSTSRWVDHTHRVLAKAAIIVNRRGGHGDRHARLPAGRPGRLPGAL